MKRFAQPEIAPLLDKAFKEYGCLPVMERLKLIAKEIGIEYRRLVYIRRDEKASIKPHEHDTLAKLEAYVLRNQKQLEQELSYIEKAIEHEFTNQIKQSNHSFDGGFVSKNSKVF